MYEEGPYEFYLRAKDNFTKSGDVEDAAELYLSLFNLQNHDIVLHTEPIITKARLLLKDAGVEDTMTYTGDGPSKRSTGHVEQILNREKKLERMKRARVNTAKEGRSYRKQGFLGKTWRTLLPFFKYEHKGNKGDGKLRERLEKDLFTDPSEGIRVTDDPTEESVHNNIPDSLIDALYSARPESTSRNLSTMDANELRHNEMVIDHPVERIPLYRDDTFAKVMRELYKEGGSVDSLDREMKRWERGHSKHSHSKTFGEYGENSVGLGDVFQHGLDLWRAEMKERGLEGDRDDFVEHLILRHEGIPEERIYDECYDGDGWDKDKAEQLLSVPWDGQSPRLGLVPKLLGLEALPPEDAKQVLRWWVSGENRDPGRNPDTSMDSSFLAGQLHSKGLLHRLWEQRKHAMVTAPLTRPSSQHEQQFPPEYWGDIEDSDLDQMVWMDSIMTNRTPQQTVVTESKRRESKGKSGYTRDPSSGPMLFQMMANAKGILPDGDGNYGQKQPVINEKLLGEWEKNRVRGFNKTMKEALKKQYDTRRKYARTDLQTNDAMSAYRSRLLPDGTPSFSNIYHEFNAGGGQGLGPIDVINFWHEFLDGLMTDMGVVDPADRKKPKDKDDADYDPYADISSTKTREQIDQMTIPLPIVADIEWGSADPAGQPGPSRTQTFDSRPWFGSDLPKGRGLVYEDGDSSGTVWTTGNSMFDFSHSPSLATSAKEYMDWKESRGGESSRQGKRITRDRLGDNAHENTSEHRRLKMGESAMKHGNAYSHKSKNDVGDIVSDFSLLDLLLGVGGSHGEDHDFFDIARTKGIDGPGGLLNHLIMEANKAPMLGTLRQPGEDPDMGKIPTHVKTDNAGITNYVYDDSVSPFSSLLDKKGERVGLGPLDRAMEFYNVYVENPQGTKDSKTGRTVFHGLEPNGPNHGNRESVYTRLNKLITDPSAIFEFAPEDLLIEPHHERFKVIPEMGGLRDIRRQLDEGWMEGQYKIPSPFKGVPGAAKKFHEDNFNSVVTDPDERKDLLNGVGGGDEDDIADFARDNMRNLFRLPLLDPEGRAFASWLPTILRGLSNTDASEDGKDSRAFHDNFGKFVIRSPHFTKHVIKPRNSVDTGVDVDMGGSGNQRLVGRAAISQEQEGVSNDTEGNMEGGVILAHHPAVLMMDYISKLHDYRDADTTPDMAKQVIQDVIDLQTQTLLQYAYSDDSQLMHESDTFAGSFEAPDRLGTTSSQLRHFLDGFTMVGTIAQALKKNILAEQPELADKFGLDAEGYANHMALFPVAEKLLHSPDQSWREPLAKKLEAMGDERLAPNIRNPRTLEHWSTPTYNEEAADEEHHARIKSPFGEGKEGVQRTRGLNIMENYLNNLPDDHGYGDDKIDAAKRGLEKLKSMSKSDFLADVEGYVGKNGKVVRNESGNVTGLSHGTGQVGRDRIDYAALMEVMSQLEEDSDRTGAVVHSRDGELLSVPQGKQTTAAANWGRYSGLGRLAYDLYEYTPDKEKGSSRSISDRDSIGSLELGNDFQPPSLFTSTGHQSVGGTLTTPTIDFDHSSKIPKVTTARRERPLLHLPPNAIKHAFSDSSLDYTKDVLYPEAWNMTSPFWRGNGDQRTAAATATSGLSPQDGLADSPYEPLMRGLDVLTDEDLITKADDGKPIPVKPMHRIFDLDDLESLQGFSGDWISTSWPKGQRLMVQKKKKTVRAWDSQGNTVTLPNIVKKGLKAAYDKNYLLDTIWDMDTLHIIDIIESGDEKMHDEEAKDRVRLLRAKFEATEEVFIPAPINTKRSDTEGLEQCVKDLLKEKGVQRVLLRDAESTYMRGEARHPRWVLLSPKKEIDVLVIASKGDRHCIGVGPFAEGIAKKMGNRKQEYEGEWYMDVGSLTEAKVEEGQHITISFSSVTMQKRNQMPIYKVNAPRYVGMSEASATDSVATLKILSGFKEENIPHTVNVQKGSIYLTFPTGQVIYSTESQGSAYLLKGVDAPDDYTLEVAQSQQEYWAPVATLLLRAEKEEVVPEPPANHDKKPKKVIPEKNRIPKDPSEVKEDVSKSLQLAYDLLDRIIKEKITWTGPKALGIDYATPVNSPSGPTENTEGYNLPDHDPGHRQEKGGDCWCGAMKGQTCEQGSGQKMEHCPDAKPPQDESKEPKHLQISHHSQNDSSA